MNTGWKSSVICFTLCLYSKILVSANIVAADQKVNLCEPPYHRFNFFAEIRNHSIFFWLSLPVHSGSLNRIDYPKMLSGPPSFFLMSLLLLKELIIIFLFISLSDFKPLNALQTMCRLR